jgi:hypothetical protein
VGDEKRRRDTNRSDPPALSTPSRQGRARKVSPDGEDLCRFSTGDEGFRRKRMYAPIPSDNRLPRGTRDIYNLMGTRLQDEQIVDQAERRIP